MREKGTVARSTNSGAESQNGVDECHGKNTREKEIHYFTTVQHAEIIKPYNKNVNIKRIIKQTIVPLSCRH